MRIDPTMPQKEETYQVILDIIKNTTCYNVCLITADVPEIFMQQLWKILDIYQIVQGKEFVEPPYEESVLAFLIELAYKGQLNKLPSMFVDYMHQPWRTLAAIINKFLSGKTSNNDHVRKSRIDIFWGMFHKKNIDYPPFTRFTKLKDDGVLNRLKFVRTGEDFQEYGRVIPDTMLTKEIKQSEAYQTFLALSTGQKGKKASVTPKKKSLISADDNIIPKPDVALELGKSISQTEAEIAEEERRLHETHERLVTAKPTSVDESDESDGELANRPTGRRRPFGITFRDISSVSKKKSLDRSQKLKGIQVPNELIGKTSSEEAGIVLEVPDEGKGSSITKVDAEINWGSKDDRDGDEEDDDRSIDIKESDDERINSENGDQAMTDAEKNVAEKVEEEKGDEEEERADDDQAQEDQVKDDIVGTLITMSQKEKPEVPRSSSKIPPVHSAPLLDVLVSIIPPPPTTTTTPTPLPTTPITTTLVTPPLPATKVPYALIPPLESLNALLQRVSTLQKDVKELKQVDYSAVIVESFRSKLPTAIIKYHRSSLGDSR
ncbi:hypothetical protein Tco_1561207 [Tanacetum coccineum]